MSGSQPDTRRRVGGVTEGVDAIAIAVMVGIALVSFRSSFGGVEFLVVGVVAAIAGIAVARVGEMQRWPVSATSVLAVGVYVVLAGVLALRDRAFLSVLPSPRSVSVALTEVLMGWKKLLTTTPPVGDTGDLMVLPVAVGFIAAFVAYLFASRRPSVALIPPFVALGLGLAVGTDRPVSVVLHGVVMTMVAFGWLAWREHQRRPLLHGMRIAPRQFAAGVIVLGVAGGVGLAAAPRMPGADSSNRDVWRDEVTPPFDPRQYPSPLSGYRNYVKLERGGAASPVMFTVRGLPAGIPIRLATMDAFDELVWQVAAGPPDDPSLRDSGSFQRVGVTIDPDVDGQVVDVTVEIGEYRDVWIPTVGEVISLRFTSDDSERNRKLADRFRYNRETDTAASVLELEEGDRYEMKVRLPNVLQDLKGQTLEPQVPSLGPVAEVAELNEKIPAAIDVLGVDDPGERLDKVRDLMRDRSGYSDGDGSAGQELVKAGHSAWRLREFVAELPRGAMVGNAEQFAATYAVFFRQYLDVQTRVVMGFRPTLDSTQTEVDVVAGEVDAWVEVPVQGLGWVDISPTPPRGQQPPQPQAGPRSRVDYQTQIPPPPPVVDPEFDQPAKAVGDVEAPPTTTTVPAEAGDGRVPAFLTGRAAVVIGIALSPFVVLALGAVGIVGLKARRRKRRREDGPGYRRVANGWNEVTDLAVDMGRPVPSTATRREASRFVGPATTALADRTDEAVWAGADLTDAEVDAYWAELTQTLGAMRDDLGVWDRVKATVSTRSLRRASREASQR